MQAEVLMELGNIRVVQVPLEKKIEKSTSPRLPLCLALILPQKIW